MPQSSRRHNRAHFFKYMSADTARIVLISRRLRWSSPFLFNDPFDVPRDIAHGFSSEDIGRAAADLLNHYLDHPPEDLTNFDETLSELFTLARGGFPAELKEKMRTKLVDSIELLQPKSALQELRNHWASDLPKLRILCLAESPNHVAMWNHYADHYSGVVLGFKCNDATDNFLLAAEPIEYTQAKPDVYTDRGLAKLMFMKSMPASRAMRRMATQTKSDDWSYEKEWRVVDYADSDDLGQYTDRSFSGDDLAHIYLGPLISEHDRHHILLLAKAYSSARVFHTKIGLDRELHFTEIEG